MALNKNVLLITGEQIASYGFGAGHPFGPDRQTRFLTALNNSPVASHLSYATPRLATRAELELFHDPLYLDRVQACSDSGQGFLDAGDTPAFRGVYVVASYVVGATLQAVEQVMAGHARRAFIPIAGLHHAARDRAAGFCVFNDCAIAIEYLRQRYGLKTIAYVDIDAHHGDGVFYGFVNDPQVRIMDIHEDGQHLYPGTGSSTETGLETAIGTKLNLPLAPGADDAAFFAAWEQVERFLTAVPPEFILFQCGADSMAGDPLAHLAFSEQAHAHAASRLCALAEQFGHGRVVAMGGGGYNRNNLARAWVRVVEAFSSCA